MTSNGSSVPSLTIGKRMLKALKYRKVSFELCVDISAIAYVSVFSYGSGLETLWTLWYGGSGIAIEKYAEVSFGTSLITWIWFSPLWACVLRFAWVVCGCPVFAGSVGSVCCGLFAG